MVMVTLVALFLAACSGDDTGAESTTTTAAPTTTAPPTTTTTVPPLTGDPLVVVEQGFSTFPDPIDPTADLGGYGVVIENPNADVLAAGVRVITRVLDDAGTELLVDSTLLNGVMPGARMAVGRTLIEPLDAPTNLDVAIEVSEWLTPASTNGQLVAEAVVTEPEESGGAVTKFTVRSTWPEEESGVDVTAVYRAEDGTILSSESTTIPNVSANGTADGQIRLLTPIPDLDTTEVYVGRGFDALTLG